MNFNNCGNYDEGLTATAVRKHFLLYRYVQQSTHCLIDFLKLDDIYRLELAKFMYQLHNKKFKTALKDCFVDIKKIHSHNTRTKHNLVYFKPRVQTSAGKKSLTYRGTELGGKIKPKIKESSWISLKKKDKTKSN